MTLRDRNVVLLCGTCRLHFSRQKVFKRDGMTYVEQPVNYTTSVTEAINNIEYLTKEKNLDEVPDEILKGTYRWNSHGSERYTGDITVPDTVCIIEVCSTKYNKAGPHIIPYKNDTIPMQTSNEDTTEMLNHLVKKYNFKAIILIPPILKHQSLPKNVRAIRQDIFDKAAAVALEHRNVYLFDWNEYFTESSFIDQWHFTNEFKAMLFAKLHRFICDITEV